MGRESGFQSRALEYMNSLPGCRAENVSGNASQSGRPDITGCFYGHMFKIELKSPDHGNEATQKQKLELRRWRRAGATVGVCYSLNSLQTLFRLDWHKRHVFIQKERNHCVSWFFIQGVDCNGRRTVAGSE